VTAESAIWIAELERAAARGWRGTDEAALGQWLLRSAGGFTGRANSALALGDPGMPLAAAAAEVCHWYQARGLTPMIAVCYPMGQAEISAIDRFLAHESWPVRSGAATVMTAAPGTVAAWGRDLPAHFDVDAEPDDAWLALYQGYRGQPLGEIGRRLLRSAPWQAFASVREAGETVAIGRVATAAGWAGLSAIEVHPLHRRQGLGRAVTGALAAAAVRRGARGLYLQVENGNAAARALYRGAGFADHHGYHYRMAPPAAGAD
jgi:N-acetylglutamate synthase